MRIKHLYALRDIKAQTIIGPITHDYSPVPLIRELSDHANNKEHFIGKAPQDYELLEIGEIDDETAVIGQNAQPEKLLNVGQLVTTTE